MTPREPIAPALKRPTIAAIKKAVQGEPDMPVANLIDELIPLVENDDRDTLEQRFEVYDWAMKQAARFRSPEEWN
jgi:hypothetical protein